MNKQCPNCGEYKLIKQPAYMMAIGGTLILVGVFFIILLPIALICFGIGFVVIIFGVITSFMPSMCNRHHCNKCHWQGELEK